MLKNCPHNKGQARGNAQPRTNPQGAATTEPLKWNRLYVMKGREEQKKSTYVVTSMLQVFSTSVYSSLNPWSKLSFVSPLLAFTFGRLLEVLHDPIVLVHL